MKRIGLRYVLFFLVFLLLSASGTLFLRLTIAHHQAPHPQAILVLGGGDSREKFAANFAKHHPNLDIWVSTGIPPQLAHPIFQAANIPHHRLHLDYRASDTVTNFTSLTPDFHTRRIHHLYLITSDFHMPRASTIAFIVLGSQGITFTPISVPSTEPPESWIRIIRDMGRSVLWVFTGRTGASIKPNQLSHFYLNRFQSHSSFNNIVLKDFPCFLTINY